MSHSVRLAATAFAIAATCFTAVVHADDGMEMPGAMSGAMPRMGSTTGSTTGSGQVEAAPPDPQRWLPVLGTTGMVSYFDQTAVRRRGSEVGVVVVRNSPAGVIRTTSGETIRSSLKRMVLNCATSMYAVVEQTLYSKRFARGESIYTIHAPQLGKPQRAQTGTIAGELIDKLCR
ncbi:surface-adhesin E family protein [Cupriavidus pauculus]|nr:surface-adhesin E family protein [Cupriavidus pauculus]